MTNQKVKQAEQAYSLSSPTERYSRYLGFTMALSCSLSRFPLVRSLLAGNARFRMLSSNTPTPSTSSLMARPTATSTSRLFASAISKEVSDSETEEENGALRTSDFVLAPPKSLSPSSIAEFQKCPQSFLFQYLWKIKQPSNQALATGTMCHAALEQVFDLPTKKRTLPILQDLFRREWAQNRDSDQYSVLFRDNETDDWNTAMETEWGSRSLSLLKNYVEHENPMQVSRPNPVQREVWVRTHLTAQPSDGVTGYCALPSANEKANEKFLVRGIIDRLDMVSTRQTADERVVLRLIDYKTGKAPNLNYSHVMNEKIKSEAFFQLLTYALLWRESRQDGLPMRFLRLFYLTSHEPDGKAVTMDMDLGATAEERDLVLQNVHATIAKVWTDINDLVTLQDPAAFQGCNRSFCYCHKCRPRFEAGTLWEPPHPSSPELL